jgi:hypothetical protein
MNKLFILIPAALIFSGCTLFPSQTATITGTEAQKAEKLAQIMASGGQADCQITNLADKSTTQMILSGKKMKFIGSDFGEGKKGTMINDGIYTYIWSEGEKVGFKTKIEAVTPTDSPDNTTPESVVPDAVETAAGYDDETKFKTDCIKRTILDTEFTPPADVNFTDLAEMMKALPTY